MWPDIVQLGYAGMPLKKQDIVWQQCLFTSQQ